MSSVTTVTRCIVCGSTDLTPFSDVIQVPVLATVLWRSREEALAAPRGEIRLGFCNHCGHIFNLLFDADRIEYSQAYENSLHFSPLFQGYAEGLARDLRERYSLEGKTVLEIGCGQGDFLRLLCHGGSTQGIGFDPSYADDPVHPNGSDGVFIHRTVFSPGDAEEVADLVVCRQVLEHIPLPLAFLSGVKTTLRDTAQAAIFVEVPDVMKALKDLDIWTIVYEHCSYFNQHSLRFLFTDAGYEVLEERSLYERLFLGIEARKGREGRGQGVRRPEELAHLRRYVDVFEKTFGERLSHWRALLEESRGRRTVLWGAGVRGVLFLNFVQASDAIASVVDINPRKHGTYVAGTGHLIEGPEALLSTPPDRIVLANPIYHQEVEAVLRQLGVQAELVHV